MIMSLNVSRSTIISPRLVIRGDTDLDQPRITAFFNRDNQDYTHKDLGVPIKDEGYDHKSATSFFKYLKTRLTAKNTLFYLIYKKGGPNTIIGCAYLMTANKKEIGMHYYILPSFRGHRYGQEAQMGIIKHASKHNKDVQFIAQMKDDKNKSSRNILLKNGYRPMGKRLPTKNRFVVQRGVLTFQRGPA
ncbi:MAG: hypothetical protein COB76_01105 [Alphaproteobacteria bacterium]|nr:MAG: hypothetical protein COB76_01105 [Alphaproteobacteria bacterium]